MKKSTKVLVVWSIASTLIAVGMTYSTVQLLESNEVVKIETEQVICPTPAEQLIERAHELREENKNYDLERYRHEAIAEVNIELQTVLYESPFVDLDELKDTYGY